MTSSLWRLMQEDDLHFRVSLVYKEVSGQAECIARPSSKTKITTNHNIPQWEHKTTWLVDIFLKESFKIKALRHREIQLSDTWVLSKIGIKWSGVRGAGKKQK